MEEKAKLPKNYNIEKVRTISAIMVILIHITAYIFSTEKAMFFNYYFYRYNLNFAVNYFFAVSGFFLATNRTIINVSKQIKKNFNNYIFASIVCILLNLSLVILKIIVLKQPSRIGVYGIFSRITLINFLKGSFGSFHLWFFLALLIVFLLYYVFSYYKFSTKQIVVTTFLLYIFLRLNVFNLNVFFETASIANGFLFFLVGFLAFEIKTQYRFAFLYFLSSFLLITLATYYDLNELHLFLFMFSIFMFLNYAKFNPGKNTWLSRLGSFTLAVYIFHNFFIQLVVRIFEDVLKLYNFNYNFIMSIIIILLSFLFSPILYKFFYKTYKKTLKFLFQ